MTFSILIPCYNIANYLEKCLESVIEQTYEDWEIIIVDDGSDDGTADIIKSYAAKNKRIKPFFQEKNQGVASARNLLLREATGNYIIFLDGDDWWKSNKGLEKIAAASQKSNMDIIVFQHEIVRNDDSREFRSNNTHLLDEEHIYTGEDFLKSVLGKKCIFQWFAFLYAFKKQLWEKVTFDTRTYALEDAEVLYNVFLDTSKLVVIHEVFYQYRSEREGSLTQPSKKFLYSMLAFCTKHIKKIEKKDIDQEVRTLLCDNFSSTYYSVLYSVNYLKKSEAGEIFDALDKNRNIMEYTLNKKYIFISKMVHFLGLHITSCMWFFYSSLKRQLMLLIRIFKEHT